MVRHSYSALQTLTQCERKYALRFMENLEADRADRPAPQRGTAWHAVMQANLLALGAARRTLLVRPDKIQVVKGHELSINWADEFSPLIMGPDFGPEMPLDALTMIAHIRSWWAHQETDYREEMEAEYGAPLADRLTDLYHRYNLRWSEDVDRYDTLITEYEWTRKAPNGILLQGRVDAVMYDNHMGIVVVRDYKTHDSWPSEPDAVLDLMDSQLHLQAWGIAPVLRELTDENEITMNPEAVQFDRARFKKPTEPKLTLKGAMSKSVTEFDSYTYKRWCLENNLEIDQSVVEGCDAKVDAWFRRSSKPLSMRSVEAHVKSLMVQAKRAESLDPKTATLVPSKSCSWCDFLPLCRAEIIGGRPVDFVPQDYGLRKQK